MSLRLLQIHLHHSKAASAALLLRLTEGGADLVLVQEPWIVGGKVTGLGATEYMLMDGIRHTVMFVAAVPAIHMLMLHAIWTASDIL